MPPKARRGAKARDESDGDGDGDAHAGAGAAGGAAFSRPQDVARRCALAIRGAAAPAALYGSAQRIATGRAPRCSATRCGKGAATHPEARRCDRDPRSFHRIVRFFMTAVYFNELATVIGNQKSLKERAEHRTLALFLLALWHAEQPTAPSELVQVREAARARVWRDARCTRLP